MPITLTVNNQPFEYPIAGDSPGWGQPASDWAVAVTSVLTELFGPNDIIQTTFNIANNVSSVTDITGLFFNTGQVRSAVIEYSIYRMSTATPSGKSEAGIMIIVYDNMAGSGSKWSLTIGPVNGNSGVTFTITYAGQIQYVSTDIGSIGYNSTMKFSAKVLAQ